MSLETFFFEGALGSVLGKLELSVKVYSELTVLLCVRCPEGALDVILGFSLALTNVMAFFVCFDLLQLVMSCP